MTTVTIKRETVDAVKEALKRQKEAWSNVLELNLVPSQHRTTTSILHDEAAAALALLKQELKTMADVTLTREDETGWLVEAFSGQHDKYLAGFDSTYTGMGFSYMPAWTADHLQALRFSRKKDAEVTIVKLDHPPSKARAVEHNWIGKPASETLSSFEPNPARIWVVHLLEALEDAREYMSSESCMERTDDKIAAAEAWLKENP